MDSKLYIAYGSNLNISQMESRCPGAALRGTGAVKGFELSFRGTPGNAHATITESGDAEVPVAVWEITSEDERRLDRYEGFPNYYFKKHLNVNMDNGDEITAMAYIMDASMQYGAPSAEYAYSVREGYNECRLDHKYLEDAIKNSMAKYMDGLAKSPRADQNVNENQGSGPAASDAEPEHSAPAGMKGMAI
jgi:gamma-glutamylcyclotransferase (GGCT)/AIG2-like uncharacterized protein YtfP